MTEMTITASSAAQETLRAALSGLCWNARESRTGFTSPPVSSRFPLRTSLSRLLYLACAVYPVPWFTVYHSIQYWHAISLGQLGVYDLFWLDDCMKHENKRFFFMY